MVPSDSELITMCIYAFKGKRAALASEVALSQGNVSVQTPDRANAEQVSHSTHIQPLHQSTLLGTTSKVPPTVSSCISMKAKCRAPSQFTLDHIAPFVANLRSNVVAPQPTSVGSPVE
jgi:hypothetical protein